MDANEKSSSYMKAFNGLTTKMQEILESDEHCLDIQEQTSLVFLMCDDPHKAYCILSKNTVDCKEPKIVPDLFDFLVNSDRQFINEKFVESLVLIKNYKLLCLLGYTTDKIEELKRRYEYCENKYYINLVRKTLFRMCEKMLEEEFACLTQDIERDFVERKCQFTRFKSMEMNLLYWICKGIISDGTGGGECELAELVTRLQKMNKIDLAKELEKVDKIYVNYTEEHDQMYQDNDFLAIDRGLELIPIKVVHSDGDCFEMDKGTMGVCVIINQRNFSWLKNSGIEMEEFRHGTNHDRDMLSITFTGFGYQIIVLENLNSICFRERIDSIVHDVLQSDSSLVLCILSHGKRDVIYCVDGIEIPVEEIESLILGEKCPQLLGKPKIVIIQACQGSVFQKALPCMQETDDSSMITSDGPTNSGAVPKVPPSAELLTFWATVPGYASFRFHNSGSVFIQGLCAQLLKYGHSEHLVDIVTHVNDDLSKKQFGNDCKVIMPQVKHTYTKKLYFPYSSRDRLKAAEMLYMKYMIEVLMRDLIFRAAALQCYIKTKRK